MKGSLFIDVTGCGWNIHAFPPKKGCVVLSNGDKIVLAWKDMPSGVLRKGENAPLHFTSEEWTRRVLA